MRRGVVLCLALSLLALSGCGHGLPQAREMDNMALMRTMGVDQGEQSEHLLVTVSSSRRPRGVQGEEEPPLILSAQGGTLAFWLDGAAARGFELAQGHPGGALLELDQGVVRLNSAALTCVSVLDGTRLTGLELDLRVIAQVEQSRQETLDRDGIARAIQDQVGGWLRAALDQAQEERADFMGLARKAGAARPGLWRQMRAQWDETFPDLEITVRCTVGLTEIRK